MNCKTTQDILNSIIDGDEPALAPQAREHLRECNECREWYSSMLQAVSVLDSCEDLVVPDIATMVMVQLPASHPVSLRLSSRRSPGRFLVWVGAGWLFGLLFIITVLWAVTHWLGLSAMVHACCTAKISVSVLANTLMAGKALIGVAGQG